MTTRARTLRLTAEEAETLEAIAGVDGVSVNEEIRRAIAAHIEARRRDTDFPQAARRQSRAQQGDPRAPGAVTAYLELADDLLIAERVLGLPAETIANFDRIGLAESALAAPRAGFGEHEAYPEFATKAAVLCWHLVKNHPLPDGNKRCASWRPSRSSSATAELWLPAPADPNETDQVIRAVPSLINWPDPRWIGPLRSLRWAIDEPVILRV